MTNVIDARNIYKYTAYYTDLGCVGTARRCALFCTCHPPPCLCPLWWNFIAHAAIDTQSFPKTSFSIFHLIMDGALAALQIAKIHIAKLLFGASFFPLGIASILFRSVSHYDSNLGLVLAISGCAPAAYLVRGIFRSEKILQQRQDESFFWREFLPYLLSKWPYHSYIWIILISNFIKFPLYCVLPSTRNLSCFLERRL